VLFNYAIVGVLAVLYLFGCRGGDSASEMPALVLQLNERRYEIQLSFVPRKQELDERTWRDVRVEFLHSIGGIEDTVLVLPTRVAVDKRGNYYVLDQLDASVKKFNPAGQLVITYGEGKGGGPGQFFMPFDLTITDADELFVLDIEQNRITRFGSDREILNTYTVQSGPVGKMAVPAGGRIIVLTASSLSQNNTIFTLISEDGAESPLPDLIDRRKIDQNARRATIAMAFTGYMASDTMEGFLYAPRYLGYLIRYDPSGDLLYAVETIDASPLPSLIGNPVYSESGMVAFGGSAPGREYESSGGIYTDEDSAMLWSLSGAKKHGHFVFDVYGIDDGMYRYSFRLNNFGQVTDIEYSNGRFYAIHPDAVVSVWQIDANP
jgi:hypothetical protein